MKNVADIWPLAPLQELMLAHSLSGQAGELMVEQFHCRLSGALDAAALRRAWETVVERHAMLRAAPAWEGLAKPVQVVRRAVELPWNEVDWRDAEPAERQSRIDALLVDDRCRGIDLAHPPLSRFHLVRLAEREWFFLWTCHHLVLDGWSLGIVLHDVFACYEQLRQGRPPVLAPCGAFGDYLKWRAAQDAAADDRFWSEELKDVLANLKSQSDPPRRMSAENSSAQCELRLSEADTARLNQLAQTERVSQSAVVQAAWALLVARGMDCEEVTFGAAVAGRPPQVPLVDTIAGPFINNIPVHVRVAGDDPLRDVFTRLRDRAVAAQPHEHCAPDQIARGAGIVGRPLFDTLVVYENYPLHGMEVWDTGSLRIRDLYGTASSNYRLTLVALPGRELVLRLLYNAPDCSPADAEALLNQVAKLLRQFAQEPGRHVDDVLLDDNTHAGVVATGWRVAIKGQQKTAETQSPATIRVRPVTSQPYVAPADELEMRVAAVWSRVLGVEPVGMTDNFLDLGGTSSQAVALLVQLEGEFGRRLPIAALFAEPTAGHLARLLRAAPQGADANPLVPLRTEGALAPLFCIHPAGGTVFCYLELAHLLTADVPMYGLQAQGIDGTLAPHETIEEMAAHYIRSIRSVQPAGPYQLCGWSTGGIVAFEIARQLLDADEEVSLVALLDAAIPRAEDNFDEADLAPMLHMLFPEDDAGAIDVLRARPLEEQVDYFRQRAERAQVLLAESGARSARGVYDVFEANLRAVVAYSPRPLGCRLTLIRASEQATPIHADPLLGWGDWAAGGTEVREVAGHHLTMLQAPTVLEVAQVLDGCLAAGAESGRAAASKARPTAVAS